MTFFTENLFPPRTLFFSLHISGILVQKSELLQTLRDTCQLYASSRVDVNQFEWLQLFIPTAWNQQCKMFMLGIWGGLIVITLSELIDDWYPCKGHGIACLWLLLVKLKTGDYQWYESHRHKCVKAQWTDLVETSKHKHRPTVYVEKILYWIKTDLQTETRQHIGQINKPLITAMATLMDNISGQ